VKCSNCGEQSVPQNERYWREVKVRVAAVPPRVGRTKTVQDVLCPLCAEDADSALEGRTEDDVE
jgi:hypothetical protein